MPAIDLVATASEEITAPEGSTLEHGVLTLPDGTTLRPVVAYLASRDDIEWYVIEREDLVNLALETSDCLESKFAPDGG